VREPAPLSRILAKVQGALKSGFRLREPSSLWVQGFLPVPVEALRDPDLNPMHLLLLGLACRYSMSPAGLHLFASQDYLSTLFCVTERYIRQILGDLVTLGYLEVQRRAHGRHNVYLVADRIPEGRREKLREPAKGLELEPGAPRERNYSSGQETASGTGVPVGTNKQGVYQREGDKLCVKYSPLKKNAAKLVADGMTARTALSQALKDWREGLDRRYTPDALAKRLRYLGIRAKIARAIAGGCAPSVIIEAAGKLDCETRNPAGAFIWHVNMLLQRG